MGKVFDKIRQQAHMGQPIPVDIFDAFAVGVNFNLLYAGAHAAPDKGIMNMTTKPTGFDIEFQMTIRGLKLGHKIIEIPTREGDRIGGESTAYSIPTGILMLKRLIREICLGKSFISDQN